MFTILVCSKCQWTEAAFVDVWYGMEGSTEHHWQRNIYDWQWRRHGGQAGAVAPQPSPGSILRSVQIRWESWCVRGWGYLWWTDTVSILRTSINVETCTVTATMTQGRHGSFADSCRWTGLVNNMASQMRLVACFARVSDRRNVVVLTLVL